jgi:hypothetical protein
MRLNKPCAICGKPVKRLRNTYCSYVCSNHSRDAKVTKECVICSKTFLVVKCREHTAKCCSINCSAFYRARLPRKPRIHKVESKICKQCGTTFFGRPSVMQHRTYCTGSCARRGKSPWNKGKPHLALSKNPNWHGGISRLPWGPEFTPALKYTIRKRDSFTCRECHQTEQDLGYKLSIHHIDFDKKNSIPDNLISLCKSCHSQTNFNRAAWTKYYSQKVLNNGQS